MLAMIKFNFLSFEINVLHVLIVKYSLGFWLHGSLHLGSRFNNKSIHDLYKATLIHHTCTMTTTNYPKTKYRS